MTGNLRRGDLQVGDAFSVVFSDGDATKCRVFGENQSRTGIRCIVLANFGRKVSYSTGTKRTFLYGNNPSRKVYLNQTVPCDQTTGCGDTETNNPMGDSVKRAVKKLSATLARVLSPGLQAQYKAGLIDDSLELTAEGKRELRAITRVAYETQLTERANQILEEIKEEQE